MLSFIISLLTVYSLLFNFRLNLLLNSSVFFVSPIRNLRYSLINSLPNSDVSAISSIFTVTPVRAVLITASAISHSSTSLSISKFSLFKEIFLISDSGILSLLFFLPILLSKYIFTFFCV